MRIALCSSLVVLLVALFSGCVQKMGKLGHVQPYEFPRHAPEGTIARGELPSPFDDPKLRKNPFHVTEALLKRGRERFEIYCTPCHGNAGYGDGVIVQRGFPKPPSYHQARLREAPDGHLYEVIRDGIGMMYAYGDRVNVNDRWAIVAYIRALQLSQNYPASQLTDTEKVSLAQEAP